MIFMDGGLIVEDGTPAVMVSAPRHQRTRAFLSQILQR